MLFKTTLYLTLYVDNLSCMHKFICESADSCESEFTCIWYAITNSSLQLYCVFTSGVHYRFLGKLCPCNFQFNSFIYWPIIIIITIASMVK